MDLEQFIENLDHVSFRSLMDACIVRLQQQQAQSNELNYAERKLVEFGKRLPAIKSVKDRLMLSLMDAKKLVDLEESKLPQNPHYDENC